MHRSHAVLRVEDVDAIDSTERSSRVSEAVKGRHIFRLVKRHPTEREAVRVREHLATGLRDRKVAPSSATSTISRSGFFSSDSMKHVFQSLLKEHSVRSGRAAMGTSSIGAIAVDKRSLSSSISMLSPTVNWTGSGVVQVPSAGALSQEGIR
jgi:hypothetical protein